MATKTEDAEFETQAKLQSFPFRKALKFMVACLPKTNIKVASVVSYSHPSSSAMMRGHSGPLVSLIPKEAMFMSNNKRFSFEYQEPTSPKVSCIGHVKKGKRKHIKRFQESSSSPRGAKLFSLRRVFCGKKLQVTKLPRPSTDNLKRWTVSEPMLGLIQRSTSAREAPALASIYIDSQKGKQGCDGDTTSLWKRRCAAPPLSLNLYENTL